jgi:hypothetical protein
MISPDFNPFSQCGSTLVKIVIRKSDVFHSSTAKPIKYLYYHSNPRGTLLMLKFQN